MHLIFHDFSSSQHETSLFLFFVSEEFQATVLRISKAEKEEKKAVKRFWNGQKTNMTYEMLGHGNLLTWNETQKIYNSEST